MSKFGEHKGLDRLNLLPFMGKRTANANLQAGKHLGTQSLRQRTNAVVPPGASLSNHLDSSKRQIDIILKHENVINWNFKVVDEWLHTFARAVHVCLRLEIKELPAGTAVMTKESLHFLRVKSKATLLNKQVEKEKPDIMPGELVFGSRISQSNQAIFRIRHRNGRFKH